MLAKIKNLTQSKFVRSVILVAGGTAGAQAIAMAFMPFITRLYSPETFGLLGAFIAITAVVSPIAALAYPVAIVLPESDDEAKSLAKLSILIALTIASILALFLLLMGQQVAEWFNLQPIVGFLIFIPLAMFFSALQEVMGQWLIRKRQFKVTARVAMSQSFILNGAKTGAGFIYPSGGVLVLLTVFGNVMYAIQLWLGSRKWSDKVDHINTPSKSPVDLKKVAYKYQDFPFYRAPQMLINTLTQSLPVLLLGVYFGPAVAGFFALSRTALGGPAALLGGAVGSVFYPKVTEVVNKGENPQAILIKSTFALFGIAIIPFLVIILFGPWVFGIVFGTAWEVSGEYARWMSLWIVTSLAARPVIAVIPALKLQGFFLMYEILFLAIKVGSLLLGFYLFNSHLMMVALYSIASAFFYIILFCLVVIKLNSFVFSKNI